MAFEEHEDREGRQIAQKESELYSLVNSGSQDLNRIGRLTLDIHNLRTQPLPSDNQYRQRALAILTPDQKPKLTILEQALRLNPPAYQAVTLNLIDGQPAQLLPVPALPRVMGPAETIFRSLPLSERRKASAAMALSRSQTAGLQ